MMLAYSALLTVGLVLSAPWWLLRMATTQRYREGLWERLGMVRRGLTEGMHGYGFQRRTVWIHAVSVGEVLAASRLVVDLELALEGVLGVVVSTTTRTGYALARERFGAERVFYMPLDFAFAVRPYFDKLKPVALVLMESELWPRMLHECRRRGVPVAVVNARVSDRSFARAMKVSGVWARVLRIPTLWLAQSEEDARRLVAMGARAEAVRVGGNLKYDVRAPVTTELTERLRRFVGLRPVVVAGSTTASVGSVGPNPYGHNDEEDQIIGIWPSVLANSPDALLVVAPRHPERFGTIELYMRQIKGMDANELDFIEEKGFFADVKVFCLNTIGDLASVYQLADIAFVGGSLVQRGGHNPLEPAQFGVPVVIGPSFENFRDIVGTMRAADAISIVQDKNELGAELKRLLTECDAAKAMGERGRRVFEEQQGATGRAVEAIVAMIQKAKA